MKKSLMMLGALVLTGVMGVMFLQEPVGAVVKCPKDSLRGENATVNSLAECNIPAEESGGGSKVMQVVQTAINVVLSLVGIICVVMIVVAGISFITSQGDASKVTKARNTILYSVVGLVIALLAFAIVNFVLANVFNGSGAGGEGGGEV